MLEERRSGALEDCATLPDLRFSSEVADSAVVTMVGTSAEVEAGVDCTEDGSGEDSVVGTVRDSSEALAVSGADVVSSKTGLGVSCSEGVVYSMAAVGGRSDVDGASLVSITTTRVDSDAVTGTSGANEICVSSPEVETGVVGSALSACDETSSIDGDGVVNETEEVSVMEERVSGAGLSSRSIVDSASEADRRGRESSVDGVGDRGGESGAELGSELVSRNSKTTFGVMGVSVQTSASSLCTILEWTLSRGSFRSVGRVSGTE